MCRRTVFLESFDSTRATSNDDVHHPNRAQAQTEALLYLLLGRSLAVNNTYGSDSVSVLELVDAVLTTRDETVRRTTDHEARERLGQARPFIVTWFGADSLLSAFAGQLRQVDPNRHFRLSGWSPIDDEVDRRRELADSLDSAGDNPHQPPTAPAWLTKEYEGLAERFETLARLAEYSRTPDAGFAASKPTIQLADYLDHFARLEQEELEGAARRLDCPLDLATAIRDEINSRREHVNLGSRSWAHALVAHSTPEDLRPHEGTREFVDTLYNAVLAESAGAQDGYMSSVPRADAREHLKQMNALALGVIRSCRESQGLSGHRPGHVDPADRTISGVFTAAETLPGLPVTALRQLFTTYWALVADRERWQAWQDSCDRLNSLLDQAEARRAQAAQRQQDQPRTTGRVDNQLRDAWAAHVNTLRTNLPGTLRGGDESLVVGAQHGANDYGQLLQIEDLAPEVRADALAVGEHLSGLAASVGG
ncbi:hypothetical protein RMN57_03355 [Kitasatospora sp. CM 4170]|uniref:Uncharacterized protein n=1 Tax=Kitasatospora aburaviensis TaxID=67265 RepID=A0ABW1EWD3_9ACTN|nr:hypothetical protein [Kitasatospora sp. CM 4170]WNM43809.1 hypothetical protein RMN57_03355 [Kitasatospora sp. CM 4170]